MQQLKFYCKSRTIIFHSGLILFLNFFYLSELLGVLVCVGTSACPAGKFYCKNVGSTPKFLFSSQVNDHFCGKCYLLSYVLSLYKHN